MILAIDESGDAGKKFWRGSSRWFLVAAVVVDGDIAHDQVSRAIQNFYKQHNLQEELHFAHNTDEIHNAFLHTMQSQSFSFVCVAVNKTALLRKKPWLFRSRLSLYNYSFGQLFIRLRPQLDHPIVLIDRNGGRWFTKAINKYLYHNFGNRHKGDQHAIAHIYTEDSVSQPLIQLADYIAGAANHFVQQYTDAHLYSEYLHAKGEIYYE